MVLGAIAAIYGAMSALHQKDLKFVIGYSSVSHMGFVMMGLGTMNTIGVNGAVLQMFSHGVMTALFFAMVGALYDQAHTRDITAFGGIIRKMPMFSSSPQNGLNLPESIFAPFEARWLAPGSSMPAIFSIPSR